MVSSINRWFTRVYDTQVDATGLGVFRIFYGLVLLAEIFQIFYFRHLMFDTVPYLQPAENDLTFFIGAWAVVVIFIIIRAFTRVATILNYFATLATLSVFTAFEYHFDYSMIGINFLLMFMPISRAVSVDRLIKRIKYSTRESLYEPPTRVSVLNNYIIVMLGIGLVYFDSVFYKLVSPLWLNGLGFWLPTSLPHVTFVDMTPFLNQKIVMLIMGYITLVFEIVFLFFIWFKKPRTFLIIIGVVLHLGILIAYTIPWFALGVAGTYILLLPDSFWQRCKRILPHTRISISHRIHSFIYKDEFLSYRQPETNPDPFIKRFKIRKLKIALAFIFICYCLFGQLLSINQSSLIKKVDKYKYAGNLRRSIEYFTYPIFSLNKHLLGIARHPVFYDNHFKGYNHVIAIAYVDGNKLVYLPVINEKGQPGLYNTGRQRINWTYRTVGAKVNQKNLIEGIKRITAFWLVKNGKSFKNATFIIRVKKIDTPNKWEKDFLKNQLNKPWQDAGVVTWKDKTLNVNIKEIEKI